MSRTSRLKSASSGADTNCAQTSAKAAVEPSSRPGDNNEMRGLGARCWALRRARRACRYIERPLPRVQPDVVSAGDDRHTAYVERVELKGHDLRGERPVEVRGELLGGCPHRRRVGKGAIYLLMLCGKSGRPDLNRRTSRSQAERSTRLSYAPLRAAESSAQSCRTRSIHACRRARSRVSDTLMLRTPCTQRQ